MKSPKMNTGSGKALLLVLLSSGMGLQQAAAQQQLPLTDLSAFKPASKTWRIAGDAQADLAAANVLKTATGNGVLVNLPTDKEHGADLFTNLVHGDADVSFEYMMAKGSNSGVYLQGRYEIQLLDSWGKLRPYSGDNGGVYERWDDSKPEGQKGYEGHAPRQNVSKAPGLWQKMVISFQAPRFDAQGKKIENARILSVQLNGVTIHENVELSGPTRGAMENNEVAEGPIRIQGDHGAVAFRNIQVTQYNKPKPQISNLKYSVYKGKYQAEPASYASLQQASTGAANMLSASVADLDNEFLIRYTGTIKVAEPGTYNFALNVPGGGGGLRINNKVVVPVSEWQGKGSAELPAGDLPFEMVYSKFVDWARPNLGLRISGPGVREFVASDASIAGGDAVDPIYLDAPQNTLLRSFVDLPGRYRVTHAVSVGSSKGLHYTYDMDYGTIVQLWRGDFADATPMWHDRGDGSSRPRGAVQYFGKPMFTLAAFADANEWPTDTASSGFRPRGYVLDGEDQPTFRYDIYGAKVQDAIKVSADGQELQRTITVENAPATLKARLAAGNSIEAAGNGLYLVDGKAYYLRVDDAAGQTPVIRNNGGGKELVVPVKGKLTYTILY